LEQAGKERNQAWQAGKQSACTGLSNSPEFTTEASNRMTLQFRQWKAVSKSQATKQATISIGHSKMCRVED